MMKLSCGVIPVKRSGKEWKFLLLRCYKFWDFPKGMMDEGENPLQTARREFTEETGLTEIEILSPKLFIETEPYSSGKVARYYLGIVTGEEEVKILPNPVTGILEHHEHKWFTGKEADVKLVPRLQKVLKWAEKQLAVIPQR